MSFFRNLFGFARGQSRPSTVIGHEVAESFRKCRIETMEDRRVLAASPLVVGAVYIEGDGGTDAQGDQFYI